MTARPQASRSPVAARCTQPTQSCVARPADPGRPQRTRQMATRQQGNTPSVRSPDRKAMRNTIYQGCRALPFALAGLSCMLMTAVDVHGENRGDYHTEAQLPFAKIHSHGLLRLTRTVRAWSLSVRHNSLIPLIP